MTTKAANLVVPTYCKLRDIIKEEELQETISTGYKSKDLGTFSVVVVSSVGCKDIIKNSFGTIFQEDITLLRASILPIFTYFLPGFVRLFILGAQINIILSQGVPGSIRTSELLLPVSDSFRK